MKPIDQTKKGHNCFAACLASILEVEIEDVPKRGLSEDKTCLGRLKDWDKLDEWLIEKHACTLVGFYAERIASLELCHFPAMYHIICGAVDKEEELIHAVVGFQGKMVHDPHPKQRGLLRVIRYTFLIPVSSEANFEMLLRR